MVLSGHSKWVNCIDTILATSCELLIASASQDNTIHIWKIQLHNKKTSLKYEAKTLNQKRQYFYMNSQEYRVVLESILTGHEAWVNEVNWAPKVLRKNTNLKCLKLLSCSLDKTAIIWEKNENDNSWYDVTRVGSLHENLSGFYGCRWNSNADNILTYDYHGSFHIWKYNNGLHLWKPRSAPGGHYRSVVDLSWEPNGRYVILYTTYH